jgi:hypothetical protein
LRKNRSAFLSLVRTNSSLFFLSVFFFGRFLHLPFSLVLFHRQFMRCGAQQTHRHAPAFASAALKQRNSRNDMSTPHGGATSVRIGEGFRSKLPYFLFLFFRDLPFVASLFV